MANSVTKPVSELLRTSGCDPTDPALRSTSETGLALVLRCLLVILVLSFVSAPRVRADASLGGDDWRGDNPDDRPTSDDMGPIYSANDHWGGPVVIAMLALFVAAAVVGPIVHAEMPEAVPPAMSHEEDPAGDRH